MTGADGILVEKATAQCPDLQRTIPVSPDIPGVHGVRDFTGSTLGKERTTLARC